MFLIHSRDPLLYVGVAGGTVQFLFDILDLHALVGELAIDVLAKHGDDADVVAGSRLHRHDVAHVESALLRKEVEILVAVLEPHFGDGTVKVVKGHLKVGHPVGCS